MSRVGDVDACLFFVHFTAGDKNRIKNSSLGVDLQAFSTARQSFAFASDIPWTRTTKKSTFSI